MNLNNLGQNKTLMRWASVGQDDDEVQSVQ